MRLSIGMMVKNESEHLEECLESLQPIMNRIDSELIIVDTGSEDDTVEIAKKFTDRVYFHHWNNDFSEMRNITLNYTQGEWFFYLDGDEIITDPDGIIEFFENGLDKKFNTGLVMIKNIITLEDDSKYSAFLAPRLFKKDKEFRFEGAVHNQPLFKGPIIDLNAKIMHYGYIATDKKLMERKFKRTAGILKDELKKNPESIYYWYQLSVSYMMHGDSDKALQPALNAYELAQKKKKDMSKYMYVYIQLIFVYFANGKYMETEDSCIKALNIRDGYIDLYFYLAKAQLMLFKNHEALENYNIYLKMVSENGRKQMVRDISVIQYTLGRFEEAYRDMSILYSRLDDYENAYKYINKISSPKKLMDNSGILIYISTKLKKYAELYEYYKNHICGDKELQSVFLPRLEAHMDKLDDEEKLSLVKLFSDSNTDYGVLNKIRLLSKDNEEDLYELRQQAGKICYKNNLPFYGEIFVYFLRQGYNFDDILFQIDENDLNVYFEYLSPKFDDLSKYIYRYIKKYEENYQIQNTEMLRTYKSLCRYVLILDNLKDEEFNDLFEIYIKCGIAYINMLYNEDILSQERILDVKNDEEVFMLYLWKAEHAKVQDKAEYIQYMRKALNIYPLMKKGIEHRLDVIKKEEAMFNDEFAMYKKEVKERISGLIENEYIDDAKKLIEEYEKIVGNDPEIYSMKGIIAICEGRLEDAGNAFRQGLSIDDENLDLLYNMGYLFEKKGVVDKALEYYDKAMALTNDECMKNEINEAIARLEISTSSGENSNVLDGKIQDLFANRQYQKIVDILNQKTLAREYNDVLNICNYWERNVNRDTGIINYFMGVAYNALGKYSESIKYHKKALELDGKLANFKKYDGIYKQKYDEYCTNCIGCNSNLYDVVHVANQSISEDNKGIINPVRIWVKCRSCGLVYANPMPSEDSMNKYYSIIAKEKFGGIYGDIDKRFEFLVNIANGRLEKIEKYIGENRTLLDIGSGIGIFIGTALDRGWQAVGLELTKEDCEYAFKQYGLKLEQRNFNSYNIDKKFDVVTLFEVIEHLRNPLKDLKRIHELIADNGILVIATPILDSLYSKKMKEKNVFWNVVTHLSYFSGNVLEKYLNLAGFSIIEKSMSKEGMGRMEFYCRKV